MRRATSLRTTGRSGAPMRSRWPGARTSSWCLVPHRARVPRATAVGRARRSCAGPHPGRARPRLGSGGAAYGFPGDPLPLDLTARSVAHGLQDAAEREPAADVVLASSPGGDAGRTFPGATAQRLMHGAPCPVAVAPDGYASRDMSEIRVIGVAVDVDPESWEAVHHAIELARGLDAHVRV